MNSLKKMLGLSIIITLVLTVLTSLVIADDPPIVTDLIAGQNHDAGDVTAWTEGTYLYVKLETQDGWEMYETHVHVATSVEEFPKEGVNPSPGQFDHNEKHNPPVTDLTVRFDNDWGNEETLYIAAHAVVCRTVGGLDYVKNQLPQMVTVEAVHSSALGYLKSYFKLMILSETNVGGEYNGWCIDLDSIMTDYYKYNAYLYSSYDASLPDGLVEYPLNLPLINWILNQDFVGKESRCNGKFTYGDVQKAIWEIIEDDDWNGEPVGPWDQCRIDEIVAAAYANGDGYVPSCGDYLAIILDPVIIEDGQLCIVKTKIPCSESCESAWSKGLDFPGGNWAMYLTYEI